MSQDCLLALTLHQRMRTRDPGCSRLGNTCMHAMNNGGKAYCFHKNTSIKEHIPFAKGIYVICFSTCVTNVTYASHVLNVRQNTSIKGHITQKYINQGAHAIRYWYTFGGIGGIYVRSDRRESIRHTITEHQCSRRHGRRAQQVQHVAYHKISAPAPAHALAAPLLHPLVCMHQCTCVFT